MSVPELYLSGTPYEMGYALGSGVKDRVLRSVETYKTRFMRAKQLTWEQAQAIARKFLPYLTGEYARYVEEMQGIADGAGLKLEEIAALNLRSELLYSGIQRSEADECTAFSAVAPATAGECVLAGQTWDFTLAQREASVIVHIQGNPSIVMFMEAGMVGGKGVNSAGLALTLNALVCDNMGYGIPLHIRMRRILESATLPDAYAAAVVGPIPVPVCLIITGKNGISLGLELAPEGFDVLMPENGILVHTNHFAGQRLGLTHACRPSASTYIRYQRIKQLMSSRPGLTQADLEEFCRDHKGGICAHPDKIEPYAGATNHAFVADLTHGRVRFVEGNPCEGQFREIEV